MLVDLLVQDGIAKGPARPPSCSTVPAARLSGFAENARQWPTPSST